MPFAPGSTIRAQAIPGGLLNNATLEESISNENFAMHNTAAKMTGKVLKATRATYEVMLENRVIQCTIRGKLVVDDETYASVKVGDNVTISLVNEREGVIEKILPRTSQLTRTIASRQYQEHIIAVNIDQLLIILSTKKPRFKSGLMDRYLVIAEKNRLRPLICINKMDLSDVEKFSAYRDYYQGKLAIPVFFTSAITGEGVKSLEKSLQNSVTALVGHSGVGKSSLIKAIQPGLNIKIAAVSERTRKGQHTTTHVQLFPLSNNSFVIDTPGVRELGFWGIYKKDLANYFVEFRQYDPECQFGDCTHIREPGCAIKNAVSHGEILEERYKNYVNIFESLKSAHYER